MESSNKYPISHILKRQVIPTITANGAKRMVVARSSYKEFRSAGSLPLGMEISHKPLQSRRTKVRGEHYYGKALLVNARWAKDGLHSLRTPKLMMVLNGNIMFQCGDAVLHCKPGHLIFIPPDIPHPDGSHNYLEGTEFPQGNCDLLFVGVHADGLVVWISTTRGAEHYSKSYLVSQKQAEHYFDLLWEQATFSGKHSHKNCGALLLLLMTSIDDAHLQESWPIQQNAAAPANALADGIATRAKEYIQNHLHEKLTIEKVARHVYLSRTQFIDQFHHEMGKTFHQYLSDYRFEVAKVLLQDSFDLPINRISKRVGLKPGMLRKMFHQRAQMTPTEFREKYRKSASKSLSEK